MPGNAVRSVDGKLDATALTALLETLANDATIQTLDLRAVGLTPTLTVALADFLETNSTLTEVNLSTNAIGTHGARCLATSLLKNTTLQRILMDGCALTSEAMEPWRANFQQATSIRHVSLKDNQIDDAAAETLTALAASLESLDLRKNDLGVDGIKQLARAVQSNTQLQTLRLDGNATLLEDEADATAVAIARGQIAFCVQRNQRLALRRRVLDQFQAICMSSFSIEVCCFECVVLTLDDAQTLSQALGSNRSMLRLRLQDNALPHEGVRRVLSALESHPTLRAVEIVDNPIGDVGMAALGRLVQHNRVLERIDITNSSAVKPSQLKRSTASALHYAFARDGSSLESLSLVNCGLSDTDVGVVASGIAWACRMKRLSLRQNAFGDRVAFVLVRLLQRCSQLETLDISGNHWTLEGVVPIVRAVATHPAMHALFLGRFEECNCASISEIAVILATNSSLTSLDLTTRQRPSRTIDLLSTLQTQLTKRRLTAIPQLREVDAARTITHQRQCRRRGAIRQLAIALVTDWLHLT
ncbi:hypothetical protein Poli38472_009876 [Pythium oligandrum]|uniref:RNI-like protein n=1 Tax=Pythium oligandrum TaxID=41045 RepID=A0A8K1FL70_PYTOL|nr:hypothetical protein Poli38472_009876 [Pythium oligandrum]|eukprot:TMW62383.1 hypothetical protein Poli38472_009876 [Pythium oligandrum]